MIIENHFDKLILFDVTELSPPEIIGDTLRVYAKKIPVLPLHPLNNGEKEIILEEAILVFKNVTKSVRTIHEYEESPVVNKFRPSYEITDVLFPATKGEKHGFGIEGLLTSPLSFVDWEIEADSFHLEIP